METIEERLKLYKRMLKDYVIALSVPVERRKFYIKWGFCSYTEGRFKIRFSTLNELIQQQPTHPGSAYWFTPGELEPRIKCIKKAIELCEKTSLETIEGRLKFYKEMLKKYVFNLFIPFSKRNWKIKSGFCCYAKYVTNKNYSLSDFPELYSQEREWSGNEAYWFKPGKLWPRIQCIRKAISLCKLELIEQELSTKNKESNQG